MSALKALERDKEISMELLLDALSEALLNAYAKTPGAIPGARVQIDRKSGKVAVLAPELDEDGNRIGEYDHTPEGFGRVAAAMLGSTETTFYTIAVYFGAAGITKTRYTIPAALTADLAGFMAAAFSVRLFFGT